MSSGEEDTNPTPPHRDDEGPPVPQGVAGQDPATASYGDTRARSTQGDPDPGSHQPPAGDTLPAQEDANQGGFGFFSGGGGELDSTGMGGGSYPRGAGGNRTGGNGGNASGSQNPFANSTQGANTGTRTSSGNLGGNAPQVTLSGSFNQQPHQGSRGRPSAAPTPNTHPVFMPRVPLMGGVIPSPREGNVAWTRGKPKVDWSGLERPNVGPVSENQHRPFDGAKALVY
jgi:hypothetical protein